MSSLLTVQNITFILGALGILFGAYSYFRDPQVKEEKNIALLMQQMKFTGESVDRRFQEVQTSVKSAFGLAQNHTHTIEVKVDTLSQSLIDLSKEVVKLATIIEERVPKR